MKHCCRLGLFAFFCVMVTSCGVHAGGGVPAENLNAAQTAGEDSVAGGGPSNPVHGTGDAHEALSGDAASDLGAVAEAAPGAVEDISAPAALSGGENVAYESEDNENNSLNEMNDDLNSQISDENRILNIQCEVRIDTGGALYTAQAAGPTIEEARDNAIEEACSIPCAESIPSQDLTEDEAESRIDACAGVCSDEAIVMAAICYRKGVSIYTEGAWSANHDPAPTNGSETSGR